MTYENEVDVLVSDFLKQEKSFQEKAKELLKSIFVKFWEENPKIVCVTWTQYTPYFNDGAPCEFSVGDLWCLTKPGLEVFEEEGGGYAEEYAVNSYSPSDELNDDMTKEEIERAEQFIKTLSKIPKDVWEDMFGDHVSIKATKEGFEVDEYEHD